MSYDLDLLTGVAQSLAAAGHGVWNPDGVYAPGVHGIVIDTMPSTPDTVTVLSAYTLTDDPTEAMNVTGLQVRTRAAGQDPRSARELANDVFLHLHGRWAWTLPSGLHVVQMTRRSHVSGGRDDNQRSTVIQNFHADLHVPDMHTHPEPVEETP